MKTATITFHASHNYGSMLQAFALQHVIRSLGHENRIINLRTNKQKKVYRHPHDASDKYLRDLIRRILYIPFDKQLCRKYELFEQFLQNELILTPEFRTAEELDKAQLDFDCYISGGDQIWNTSPSDFDWSYFLTFAKGKKISYSVSMGPCGDRQVSNKPLINKYLNSYSHISVREIAAKRIIETLVNKPVTISLDPVLLLTSKEWKQYYNQQPLYPHDYIFIYTPEFKKDVYEIAVRLGKQLRLPIITSTFSHHDLKYPRIHKFLASGPWEFLNLLQHARLVVSGSYHAVIFSILFEKPFFAVNGDKDDRMKMILENTQLLHRSISHNDYKQKQTDCFNCNFANANLYLSNNRLKSIDYLQNAIEK